MSASFVWLTCPTLSTSNRAASPKKMGSKHRYSTCSPHTGGHTWHSQFIRCSFSSVAKTCLRDMIQPMHLILQVVTGDSLSNLSLCISSTATFNFVVSPQPASPPVQLAHSLQQRSPSTPPGRLRQSSAGQFHGFALQLFDAWFIDTSK